ncbi:hypothetical protein [Rhizobium rhizosphaerae]|uniref:hypothetical protein n=1 Tax=Xaviernesmea rhizosphaerae TaxID=1672749 RepID=UPI00117ADF79|nr:hypothetical protein [Xaviernesmea rhizosphaerae]
MLAGDRIVRGEQARLARSVTPQQQPFEVAGAFHHDMWIVRMETDEIEEEDDLQATLDRIETRGIDNRAEKHPRAGIEPRHFGLILRKDCLAQLGLVAPERLDQ